MNVSQLADGLLGATSAWHHLGDGLHGRRGRVDFMELWPLALVLVVVALVIAAVVFMRKRNDMSQPCDDPNKLFRELSLAHDLDRASQKLLWRLAEAMQLAQPAEVFLQPAFFQAELPEELHGEEGEFEALHERLF